MEILKNIKKNTVIIIFITAVVMFFVLKDEFPLIITNLQNLDLTYIFIAVLCFIVYIVLGSYVVYKTVNQKEKFSLLESIKHKIIVQFFNGVTPFSTGGQPMEIYMLSKHGISISKSTNYILQNFVFYQVSLVLFGLFAIILNYTFHFFPQVPFLKELVILGFIVNTLVALVLVFISLSKKITYKVILTFITFFNKLHLVKNIDNETIKWNKRLNEFHECTKELKKNKSLLLLGITFNIVGLAFFYLIPLFLAFSLKDFSSLTINNTLVLSAYVMIVSSFIPIPGATGGIEYAFTVFFSQFLTKSNTSTILILWRFITYYLGMILGAILFSFDKENIKER